MTTGTATRPRISAEFIAQHRRLRITRALAECIVAKGYEQTSVADIVSTAGIARNTFYETFGSKGAAADWLIAQDYPDLLPLHQVHSTTTFTLELVAPLSLGNVGRAASESSRARWVLRELESYEGPAGPASPLDPLQAALPPGRHGLPRDFVLENQRQRLFSGMVAAIVDRGYPDTRISDVVDRAAASRRAFYEHFDSKHLAAEALLTSLELDQAVAKVDLESGLGSLVMEIAAALLAGDPAATVKIAGVDNRLDGLRRYIAEASDA